MLYRLPAYIHADREDRRTAAFDRMGHISGTNGRFIGVTRAISAGLIQNVISESFPRRIIWVISEITGADVGRRETVAQEDHEFILISCSAQHILRQLQTSLNVRKSTVRTVISACIYDISGLRPHDVFQCFCLISVCAGLQIKNLMRIGIKCDIANLADPQRVILRKMVKELFCRIHCRLISGRIAKF